jgi:dCTP deaminase
MRTPIKLRGLINVSGFHVDPGYKGKLIYGVYNASPTAVHVIKGEPLFKIWFCDLDSESSEVLPSGMIKGPKDGIYEIKSDLLHGMSKGILSLQALADKLREQDSAVQQKFAELKPTLAFLEFVWRGLIIALLVALVLAILGLEFPMIYRGLTASVPSTAAILNPVQQ